MLGEVYGHDAEARERGLRPEEPLQFHQERSGPVMEKLHGWLEVQFAERKTEPNSELGKAITYLLRHWRPLTLFLRQAGRTLSIVATLIGTPRHDAGQIPARPDQECYFPKPWGRACLISRSERSYS